MKLNEYLLAIDGARDAGELRELKDLGVSDPELSGAAQAKLRSAVAHKFEALGGGKRMALNPAIKSRRTLRSYAMKHAPGQMF